MLCGIVNHANNANYPLDFFFFAVVSRRINDVYLFLSLYVQLISKKHIIFCKYKNILK